MTHHPLHQPRRTSQRRRAHRRAVRRAAFTLVELLVSIGLAVLLIAGVNEVFRLTTRTVSASNALSDVIRDNRAFQAALAADTHAAAVEDAPYFIIRAQVVRAFRNADDQATDANDNPSDGDFDGDGIIDTVRTGVYNYRNHRADILSFFKSEFDHRQTGGNSQYVSRATAFESYISYGHMQVRNNEPATSQELSASYRDPGETPQSSNPNNFFASQWILGRSQVLLGDPVSAGEAQYISRADNNTNALKRLAPVGRDSRTNFQHPSGSRRFYVQENRYDMAEWSMNDIRRTILQNDGNPSTAYTNLEWRTVFAYRFWSNPFSLKPIDPRQVAQASNIFLRSCTQFIVEFAGDYLTQPDNANDSPGADGKIDVIRASNAPDAPRRIRWYGYFRDVSGPSGGPDGVVNPAVDVVPVTMVVGSARDFEPDAPTSLTATTPYFACWKPQMLAKTNGDPTAPKMLRITVTLDDPAGKLTEGQTYEYIYKLGY